MHNVFNVGAVKNWEIKPFTNNFVKSLPAYPIQKSRFSQIPWLSQTFLCGFSLTSQDMFYPKNAKHSEAKNILANIWFERKVHLNQGWNLVHLSQSKILWLSRIPNKIPWLTRKKILFPRFSDFPWCWEPWKVHTLYDIRGSSHDFSKNFSHFLPDSYAYGNCM